MKYLLDTDTLINFLKGQKTAVMNVVQTPFQYIAISTLTYAEVSVGLEIKYKGNTLYDITKDFLRGFKICDFNLETADKFGKIKSDLYKKGQMIDDIDIINAGIAIQRDLILVTHNTKQFSRIDDLEIMDWSV